MPVDPAVIAQADQELAAAAEFLDAIIATEPVDRPLPELVMGLLTKMRQPELPEGPTTEQYLAVYLALAIKRLQERQ